MKCTRILALLLLALTAAAAAAQDWVYPSDSLPAGKSYEQWAAKWWQWQESIPLSRNPVYDLNGAYCGVGQHGPVWFLAGTSGGDPVSRSCTIPHNKLIFFPIINYLNDYPCHFQASSRAQARILSSS